MEHPSKLPLDHSLVLLVKREKLILACWVIEGLIVDLMWSATMHELNFLCLHLVLRCHHLSVIEYDHHMLRWVFIWRFHFDYYS